MWINEMLTIWLYGSLFSLGLISFSLWKWYRPGPAQHRRDDESDA